MVYRIAQVELKWERVLAPGVRLRVEGLVRADKYLAWAYTRSHFCST